MTENSLVIIAHGGAGGINYPTRRKRGLVKAVRAGYEILKRGGSSLDAVEKATMILEDTKVFNAGTGSYLNLIGTIEMDASIMTSNQEFGAVAGITEMKNPICVARLIMEKTDHLLLCGEGAKKFARLMGFGYHNPETREKRKLWERRRKDFHSKYFPKLKDLIGLYGTIGVVAIDRNGLISVTNSTGGINMRMPGRVGDTPIIGGGIYADKNGGVTATGHGEKIMKNLLCYRAVSLMARYSASVVGRKIVEYATRKECPCGLIGVDKRGGILCVNNTKAMSWAYIKDGRLRSFP